MQKLQILTHNVDDLKTENQELCRRLSQQEALQNCPDDDLRVKKTRLFLKETILKYQCNMINLLSPQVKCQSLASQLQDAQTKLVAEREETKNIKRHAEFLDGELLQLREQMEKVVETCEQAQRRSGKQEVNSTRQKYRPRFVVDKFTVSVFEGKS